MNFSKEEINNYYSFKNESYNKKYNSSFFTHVHTGLYSKKSFPYLFDDNFELKNLGLDRIKYLLFKGQETLSLEVLDQLRVFENSYILDCGCGYCATSILASQKFGGSARIKSISLSRKQLEISKKFIQEAHLSDMIEPEVMNIFEFKPNDKFNAIYSIDATCQMGDYPNLFKKLHDILEESSPVVIADHFLGEKTAPQVKSYFDNHWKSDISSIHDLLNAAISAGFTILKLENKTKDQIPFWKLSKSHSELMLNQPNEEPERKRLLDSKNFHSFLIHSYVNRDMQYYQVVLEK